MGNRISRAMGGGTAKDAQVEKPGKFTRDYPTVSVSKEKLAHLISEVLENYRARYKCDASFMEELREIVDEEFDKVSLLSRASAEDEDRQKINAEDVELAIYIAMASSLVAMLPESAK